MNYLLLIELLIVLFIGMKLGILIYKNEYKFEFYSSVLTLIIWIIIIFTNFGIKL